MGPCQAVCRLGRGCSKLRREDSNSNILIQSRSGFVIDGSHCVSNPCATSVLSLPCISMNINDQARFLPHPPPLNTLIHATPTPCFVPPQKEQPDTRSRRRR